MTLPLLSKCVTCQHFTRFVVVADPETQIEEARPECLAFPNGIPDVVYTWNDPHISVRDDQIGDFVFDPDPDEIAANPGIPDVLELFE